MATNKSSFILYSDIVHTVKKLPDDIAGKLFKHVLMYVNDEEPVSDDLLVNIAFEPIKQSLKRDLKKWDETKSEKSIGGRMGNLKRWHPDLYQQVVGNQITLENAEVIAHSRKASDTDKKIAVSVSDNVSDNVSVSVSGKSKEELMNDRKLKFAHSLESFKDTYPRTMLTEFYKYWGEPNKSKTKFKQELEKTWDLSRRLETWAANDRNFKKDNLQTSNTSTGLGKSKELN